MDRRKWYLNSIFRFDNALKEKINLRDKGFHINIDYCF